MSNENENEEQELALASAAVAGLNNVVGMVCGISSNVRNIRYNAQNNTTTYYGHSNFEEVKVNGNNVSLANHTHTSADISNWATATQNYAKINTVNTFTSSQTFNGNIIQLEPNLASGRSRYIYIGKRNATDDAENDPLDGDCGFIRYYYHTTSTSRFMRLGLVGYDGINIYKDKITFRNN